MLMLQPAEPPAFYTPLTITCGAKLVRTYLEPTTFDPQGRTLISIHLMLAAEQLPTLTNVDTSQTVGPVIPLVQARGITPP